MCIVDVNYYLQKLFPDVVIILINIKFYKLVNAKHVLELFPLHPVGIKYFHHYITAGIIQKVSTIDFG